jgi:hypothetical protein
MWREERPDYACLRSGDGRANGGSHAALTSKRKGECERSLWRLLIPASAWDTYAGHASAQTMPESLDPLNTRLRRRIPAWRSLHVNFSECRSSGCSCV